MENQQFPYALVIRIPFPTARLANIALHALSVDEELSPLVRRSFSLNNLVLSTNLGTGNARQHLHVSPLTGGALHLGPEHLATQGYHNQASDARASNFDVPEQQTIVLVADYKAKSNRMLRVSVNGFFESLGIIVNCMRELDEDLIDEAWVGEGDREVDDLTRVQGLEEVGILNA